jgi:hypothetical protein
MVTFFDDGDEFMGDITARYFSVGRIIINCSNKILNNTFGLLIS